MSFGEGDLHARVDALERENVRLRDVVRMKDRYLEVERELFYKLSERDRKLKRLAIDMYGSLRAGDEVAAEDMYAERVDALGLLEGGE